MAKVNDSWVLETYPSSTLLVTNPAQSAAKERGYLLNNLEETYARDKQSGGELAGLENISEAKLTEMAIRLASKKLPGQDARNPELVAMSARYRNILKDAQRARISIKQNKSASDPVSPGVAAKYPLAPLPEGSAPPSKMRTPWEALKENPITGGIGSAVGTALDVIGVGGRTLQGAHSGALRAQRLNPALISPTEIAAELSAYKRGITTPKRKGGAAVGTVEDESTAQNMWEQGGLSVLSSSFSDESPSTIKELAAIRAAYQNRARMFVESHPGLVNPTDAATKLTEVLIANDELSAQLNHPYVTQLALELAGDLAIGNVPGAVLRGTRNAVGAIPVGGGKNLGTAAKEVVKDLEIGGRRVVSNVGAGELELAGRQDLANEARLAQHRSSVPSAKVSALIGDIQAQLNKVPKKDKALFASAIDETAEDAADALIVVQRDPKLSTLYAKYKTATDALYKEGIDAKSLQRLTKKADDSVMAESANKVDRYTPKAVMSKDALQKAEVAAKEAGFIDAEHVRQVMAGDATAPAAAKLDTIPEEFRNLIQRTDEDPIRAAKFKLTRKGSGAEQRRSNIELPWDPDPKAQWARRGAQEPKSIARSKEVQELDKAFSQQNMIKRVHTTRAHELAAIGKEKFGIEFSALDDAEAKEWFRATAKPGDVMKQGETYLVPKAIHSRVRDLYKYTPESKSLVVKALKEVNDYLVRPLNKWTSISRTMLAGAGWFADNLMGSVSIDANAVGLQMLNPKLHYDAAKTAIGGLVQGSDTAAKAIDDAVKVPVSKWMAEDGALNQVGEKFERDIVAKGPLGLLDKVGQKTAKGLGIEKANNLLDNYQRAMHYIGFMREHGFKESNRAGAMEFVRQMGGLYHDMSPFQREVVRDWIPYFAWKKASTRALYNAVENNSDRVQFFVRSMEAAERYYGGQAPYGPEAISATGKATRHITAPPGLQPGAIDQTKKPTKLSTGEFTTIRPETLLTTMADYSNTSTHGPSLQPIPSAVLWGIQAWKNGGKDPITGYELKLTPDIERFLETIDWGGPDGKLSQLMGKDSDKSSSVLGAAGRALFENQISMAYNVVRAYYDSGMYNEAIDLSTRLQLARQLGPGLKAIEYLGDMLGKDWTDQSVGSPFLRTRSEKPLQNINRAQAQ